MYLLKVMWQCQKCKSAAVHPDPSWLCVQWSLSTGAGARRLAEVRTRAAVQLLLVQACGEIFHVHSQRLQPDVLTGILDVVKQLADHARHVDMDMNLRRHLAAAQVTDKVCHHGIPYGQSSCSTGEIDLHKGKLLTCMSLSLGACLCLFWFKPGALT